MNKLILHKKSAFSLVEIIFAIAVFILFCSAGVLAVLGGLDLNRSGKELTTAVQYATEGLEGVRSIRNRDFTLLVNSVAAGLTKTSGLWVFNGTQNLFDKYTRVITVGDVLRDSNGNIVSSGGTLDADSKKITSTVSWNANSARANNITLTTYLTNFRKVIATLWSNPLLLSTFDLPTNGNALKIKVQGNYAYLIRDNGTPFFIVLDVSNPASPSIVGSIPFANNLTDIAVSGNYAYISSGDNTTELTIVDISNPASPAVVGSFNATGNANARSIFVSGNTAYLVRDNSGDPELYLINVSNPASPAAISSLNLNGNLNAVFKNGNFVFIASSDDTREFQVVNVTVPATPVLSGSLNLTGTNDSLSIAGFSNSIILGRAGGSVVAINVSVPATPSLLGSFNASGNVNDIDISDDNTLAFLATSSGTAEFRVLDITNLSSLTSVGLLNMSAQQNGVDYDATLNKVFLVGNDNAAEVSVVSPN